MRPQYQLTIGVPTYNRATEARHNLESMLAGGLSARHDVEILFIDNHSTDDTFESLKRTVGLAPNVRILSNARTVGFGGNVLRIIAESRASYVLFTSDEDLVDVQVLDDLLAILRPQTYAAVTSYFSRGDADPCPRGSPLISEIVDPSRYKDVANYISGVCFFAAASKKALPMLESYADGPLGMYIQNLLVAVLMLEGPVLSWERQICFSCGELPTSITSYNGLQQRWNQAKEYLAFTDALDATDSDTRRRIASIRQGTIDNIVGMFSHAVFLDGVNYQRAFEASVVNHALRHVSTKTLAREVLSRVRKKIKSFFLR